MKNSFLFGVCGTALMIGATFSAPVEAQVSPAAKTVASDDAASTNSEDIVVTARKREERAIDVPIALTTFDGKALRERGANNLSDFLQEAPGVGIYDFGSGNQKITIRGVSTSLGGNANGYYLDDLPFTGVTIPIEPDVRAWDLDRVEVLRGPQGTLFGEGSMGGTVRILTANPDLKNWLVRAEGGLSVTKGGGENHSAKGTISVPVIPDLLAVRVSGTYERFDGWIDDAKSGRRRVNEQDYDTLRAKVLFTPTDRLTLNGTYWQYRGTFPNGGSAATDANQIAISGALASKTNYDLYGGSARYDLGFGEVFYGYSHNKTSLPISGPLFGGTLDLAIDVTLDTHELRLASTGQHALQWTVGAYQRTAVRIDSTKFALFGLDNLARVRSKAQALFGEGTYTLPGTPIDLTAGLRYFQDEIGSTEANAGVPTVPPGGPIGRKYHSFNPRFSIAWRPARNVNIYASAAKGFRSGQLQPGTSVSVASALGIPLASELSQDSIWTYELGAKAAVLDGRLSFEGAVYHSDWKDVAVRIPLLNTGISGLANSDGIKTSGVEASIVARPTRDFTMSANASYVDSHYAADVPGTAIVKGSPVEDVVKFTTNVSAQYRRRMSEVATLSASANYQHSSPRSFRSSAIYIDGDTIDRLDAQIGVELQRVAFHLFVDNLTNEQGAAGYRTVAQVAPGVFDSDANRLRPRTIGLRATLEFSK